MDDMKRIKLLFGLLVILNSITFAQTIELIPNLNENDLGFWGSGLLKDAGSRTAYKGNLYFSYRTPDSKSKRLAKFNGNKITLTTNACRPDCFIGPDFVFKDFLFLGICDQQTRVQLAKYDGALSLTNIPNPTGYEFESGIVNLNSIEYLRYWEINKNRNVIGQYDGEKITIIPNSIFDGDSALVYNNALYFDCLKAGKHQLCMYDGEKLSLIPNPKNELENSYLKTCLFSVTPLIVFNKLLYLNYCYSDLGCNPDSPPQSKNYRLAKYDGQNVILLPDPFKGGVVGICDDDVTVYKNKLYMYYTTSDQRQLAVLDGDKISLMPNPDKGGCIGGSIVYKDLLFFGYGLADDKPRQLNGRERPPIERHQLAKFDGSNITLIPNVNIKDLGIAWSIIILFNNEIYFGYENSLHKNQLAKYDGTKITLFSNPDDGVGFSGNLRTFNNYLLFDYKNSNGKVQLAKFR